MRRCVRSFAALVALALCAPAPAFANNGDAPEAAARVVSLRQSADLAVRSGDWRAARDALARLVDATPSDPAARYNLACAHARLGEIDAAQASIQESIGVGFVDFFHLLRDPDLAPLRDDPRFRAVLGGWRELLDARGDSDLDAAKQALGPRYHAERDVRLRVNIISSFDARSTDEARAEITAVAEWGAANLFAEDAIAATGGADGAPARPHHWVTLILPTTEDFVRFVPAPGVGGIYDKDRRILVSRDLGPGLRHEFLHVLHHRRMSRLGQDHAHWVQEGLGALVEDFSRPGDAGGGAPRPVPNWRTNIAKRLESRGALTPWGVLFAMPRERFSLSRPIANYAQARAIFLFLEQRSALGRWLREYERTYDEDPTGASAFVAALGAPLVAVERDFEGWLRALPAVAEEIRPGMPSLGVIVSEGEGEGPKVEQVVTPVRGVARDERLCPGDIVTAVGGAPTRTMEDLVRALAEHEAGDTVEVGVKRGTRRLTMRVILAPLPAGADVP